MLAARERNGQLMEIKQRLFFTCLAVAGLSLMVSFYLFHQLPLALAALIPVGTMLLACRRSQTWLVHLSLVGFTGLSAVGILLDIPLILMVPASTAALAGWDLLLEMHTGFSSTVPSDRLHLRYLGIAVGLGLFGVGIGSWIQWRVPFVVMLIIVIIIFFSLNEFIHHFLQDNNQT
jgi:hypothetical protein